MGAAQFPTAVFLANQVMLNRPVKGSVVRGHYIPFTLTYETETFWSRREVCADCQLVFRSGRKLCEKVCSGCGSANLEPKTCKYEIIKTERKERFLWFFTRTIEETSGRWIFKE